MRINWKNIYGILGVIFCIWLFRNAKPLILNYLEHMQDNNEYLDKHPALPFLALALVCVTVVVAIKLHSERKR